MFEGPTVPDPTSIPFIAAVLFVVAGVLVTAFMIYREKSKR